MWNIEKKLFSTREYVEIHIQRPFIDNKKGISKIVVLKIQTLWTCFDASSMYGCFLFWKTSKTSIFGGISKFLKQIVLGQILANIWQFWANFATMAVVDSMPSFEKNKTKNHNSWRKC
jgi:hypothetical protein